MSPEYKRRGNLPRSIFVPGGRYFITTAVRARAPVFEDRVLRFILLRDLVVCSVLKEFDLLALSVLPDHIHLLIKIKSINTSKIMQSFKTNSSKNINAVIRPADEFRWQQSFYDRLVRDDGDYLRLKRYILNNPTKHDIKGLTWVRKNNTDRLMRRATALIRNAAYSEAGLIRDFDKSINGIVYEVYALPHKDINAVEKYLVGCELER
jgi:putative transposase